MNRPFHELSIRLEQGVDDLRVMREDGVLKERLFIDDSMQEIIEQILDTGTCTYLQNILHDVPTETEGKQMVLEPSDENPE